MLFRSPIFFVQGIVPKIAGKRKLWDPQSGESHRPLTPILLKSNAIHLPFLSRYFCKSMPSSWQKVAYTPPICITIRLSLVSRYFLRSIRVRGRGTPPTQTTSKTSIRVCLLSRPAPLSKNRCIILLREQILRRLLSTANFEPSLPPPKIC